MSSPDGIESERDKRLRLVLTDAVKAIEGTAELPTLVLLLLTVQGAQPEPALGGAPLAPKLVEHGLRALLAPGRESAAVYDMLELVAVDERMEQGDLVAMLRAIEHVTTTHNAVYLPGRRLVRVLKRALRRFPDGGTE